MTGRLVESVAELREALAANAADPQRRRVRLRSNGSRPRLCAAPPANALELSLRGLARIDRLEPDDLTCSVEPGVSCRELAAALAAQRLELGGLSADDPGTVGGLYATDPLGPASPGAACPRSTLLGVEAVLADGRAFRAGARVVKSVAGFDVHKLFVGSMGRLFAVTMMHLKLRPAPRARVPFASAALPPADAVRLFLELRALPSPPPRLSLRRTDGAVTVHGCFVGRAQDVAERLARHTVREAAVPADHLTPPAAGQELLIGRSCATRLASVLAAVPDDAPFVAHAGGHFETTLAPAAGDALLRRLPDFGAHGIVALGAVDRIGRSTPQDPGAALLQQRLARALDPLEVFA